MLKDHPDPRRRSTATTQYVTLLTLESIAVAPLRFLGAAHCKAQPGGINGACVALHGLHLSSTSFAKLLHWLVGVHLPVGEPILSALFTHASSTPGTSLQSPGDTASAE